ncbi:DUF4097 family beta strand repeat-containing protein [Kitasatospora sp. NPDC058965]|uniref:DUF4097 family beta strand repeat-containing protein n=1 Tax=Kitasatospora sp. NPDC058965 TaxID=3346682 RepID=UPI0036B20180
MQTFATPAPITTVLDIPAGRIRFVATDRIDTVVEVRPANAAKRHDVGVAELTSVDYADGMLQIRTAPAKHPLIGHSGAVEVTVQLPAGSRVEARADSADLHSTGRLGDVTFESSAGEVGLDEVASARLTVQAGDIAVGRLGGPAELRTRKGDLTVTEAALGEVVLHTEAGQVSVGAARGVSASLDAGTGFGRIHNALRNGEGGASTLRFRATTGYGDITARSL